MILATGSTQRGGRRMEPIWFTAILTDEKGRFLEKGFASLPLETNSLCFKSSFVPLLKIGTLVTIIRTLDDRELESFHGEVYVSSRQFLRITAVDEGSLKRIKSLFGFNTAFESFLTMEAPVRFPFYFKKPQEIYAAIYYLSMTQLKFQSMDKLETGNRLILDIEKNGQIPFDLKMLELEIDQVVHYGGMSVCYIGSILRMPEPTRANLDAYLDQNKRLLQKKEQPPSIP